MVIIKDLTAITEYRKRREARLDAKSWAEELNLGSLSGEVRPMVAEAKKSPVVYVRLSSDMRPLQEYRFLDDKGGILSHKSWLEANRRALRHIYDGEGMDAVDQEYYKGLLVNASRGLKRVNDAEILPDDDCEKLPSDGKFRRKLIRKILEDRKIRNEALNVMYDNYCLAVDGCKTFEEFLNTPVTVYKVGDGDVFSPYSFLDDGGDSLKIRPIDTFGSIRRGVDAAIMVPFWRTKGEPIREEDRWTWTKPEKYVFEEKEEELAELDILDAIKREAEMVKLFSGEKTDTGRAVVDRCVDSIQRLLKRLAIRSEKLRTDSAFFAGELDDNLGENYVQYPEVQQFRERRQKRLDAKGEEGRWVTTENDHKVHLNEEGVPDKGNPHVLKTMTNGTRTREQVGMDRVKKVRGRMAKSLEKYKEAGTKVQEKVALYEEAAAKYKKASRRLESAEWYKKTLDSNGIKDGDRDRLQKEVDELEKKKAENPYDRDIGGEYNNKSFLLALYDDVYGEQTKEYRRDIKKLQEDADSAKKALDKSVEERRSARGEIAEHSRKNVQSIKFYSADERDGVQKQIMSSDAFAGLSEEEQSAILASIQKASDAQLSVLKKTCGKARFMGAEEAALGGSCYRDSSGIIYLDAVDRKDPKVFWHEYGHFMDDFKHSGLEHEVVMGGEGTKYEYSTDSFSDILYRDVKIFGGDAAKDIQEMLDGAAPGRFKVNVSEDEGFLTIVSAETGEIAEDDPKLAWDLQKAFDQVIDDYLNGGPNGGAVEEYRRSIGYPSEDERPNRDDYIETYVTPKRKLSREKEKFKGAEEEYHKKLAEYFNKQDVVKRAHPEYEDTISRLYEEKQAREKVVAPVTDCLCASMMGQVFSIYGCHEKDYYRTGYHAQKEWAANIHQMMFMGDSEATGLLSKLMPRTMKKVKSAYNEYLWRNLSE